MSLKDLAYASIKDAITNCIYAPGTFLNEREIIKDLGISRTPFREAVNALSREGLVDIVPHKGIFVTEITLKDVMDLYRIREHLEPFAVTLAMENLTSDSLETLRFPLSDKSESEATECTDAVREDEDLHHMLLRLADNKLLTQMMGEIYDHNHRIRILSIVNEYTIRITEEQHSEIIRHMQTGNTVAAAEAMRVHITSSKDRALAAIVRRSNLNIRL